MNRRRVADVAPRAWAAICDLVGGAQRVKQGADYSFGDSFITYPAVALTEPMNFDRADPAEYSLVERAVLRALGVERLAFRPAAPRERVIPEREARQARMLAEQKRRLGLA